MDTYRTFGRFNVTYAIVTPESAEYGDVDESGFISQDVRLRDAVSDLTAARTNRSDSGDGLEPSGRWWTYYHGVEFETGAQESRALHPPKNITPASMARLDRLLRRWC